jgi:two-component system, NarL family, nitrate/nitrite response regulator NarL
VRQLSIPTILVGPRTLRREGISRALDSTDFRIVADWPDLQKVELADPADRNHLLLILECGHDVGCAIQKVEKFRTEFPDSKVVLLADDLSLEDVLSTFRAGASAYFVSIQTCEAFVKALELVMLGETILPRELLTLVDKDTQEPSGGSSNTSTNGQGEEKGEPEHPSGLSELKRLSEREKDILRCIIDGDSNKHVARKLNIAEATVKVHVKAIFRKIRVQNRTQAAIWAMNKSGSDLVALKDDLVPPLALMSSAGGIAVDWLSLGRPYKIDIVSPLSSAIDLSRGK